MEISGKVLREVEFRDRLRGYDTDEVDEFLEKCAVAIDEMHAEIARLSSQRGSVPAPAAAPAPVRAVDDIPTFDDDSIRRTLVLAQRTADLAVSEARAEADRILAEAHAEADAMVAQAQDTVRKLRGDAEQESQNRVERLESERERLERETGSLVALLNTERERLTQGLGAALRFVEETLVIPADLLHFAEGRSPESASRPGTPPVAAAPAPVAAPPAPKPLPVERRSPERRANDARAEVPVFDLSDPGEKGAPSPWYETRGGSGPSDEELPDVEAQISEDAATAVRHEPSHEEPKSGGPVFGSPPPTPPLDADDSLWSEWASSGAHEGAADESNGRSFNEGGLQFEPGPSGDEPA